MSAPSRITYIDHSGEKSRFMVEGATLNAANFDAQMALWATLRGACAAVSLGARYADAVEVYNAGVVTPPAQAESQRELKWLISYADAVLTNRRLSVELPCADVTADPPLIIPGTDLWDPDHADWVAFKDAFEAYVKAPVTGNGVTLLQVRLVGRKL